MKALACPRCGAPADVDQPFGCEWFVSCDECYDGVPDGHIMAGSHYRSQDDAIESWNDQVLDWIDENARPANAV